MKDARSGLFPQLDATGSYTYLDPIIAIWPSRPGLGNSGDAAFQPPRQLRCRTRLSYLASDFGQRNSRADMARVGSSSTRHQLDQVRNDPGTPARSRFYGLLGMQEAIKVQEAGWPR